jgi:multiple sugar transport system permease protein
VADLIDTGVSAPQRSLSTSDQSIGRPPRGSSSPGLRKIHSWIDKRFFAMAAAPAIVLVTLVTLVPLIIGIYLSFTNYEPINPSFKFAGLVNYRELLHDGNTHAAIKNSLIFAGAGIVIELLFGLGIALLLSRRMRGMSILRTIYVLPLMVAGVASAVTWRALLNTSNGWVNYFLGLVGLGQPNWLASTTTAMPSVILADAWGGVPIIAIVLLAGLLSLPKEPVDAARMDGASEFAILRYITLPGIRPVLAFAVLFRLVDLFRQFALFSIVTGGGPGLATNVLNFYVYQTTFVFGELGYGAALAIALVVLMAIPLLIIFKLASRGR